MTIEACAYETERRDANASGRGDSGDRVDDACNSLRYDSRFDLSRRFAWT